MRQELVREAIGRSSRKKNESNYAANCNTDHGGTAKFCHLVT